jgi:hypothetical protein
LFAAGGGQISHDVRALASAGLGLKYYPEPRLAPNIFPSSRVSSSGEKHPQGRHLSPVSGHDLSNDSATAEKMNVQAGHGGQEILPQPGAPIPVGTTRP